jgi:hypothetical protein
MAKMIGVHRVANLTKIDSTGRRRKKGGRKEDRGRSVIESFFARPKKKDHIC